LRRRLPHPQPLTSRLDRLRRRLATHSPVTDGGGGLIWAAVAVVIVPEPDAVLFIRRAERTGDPWSGHMALPGGRRDPGDADLTTTAIRETAEEVGLELPRTSLLGSLDDVVPRTPVLPPIAVRPYVFGLPQRPSLTLNPEVAAARWVHLDYLLSPDTFHSVRIRVRGEDREFPAYQLEDAIVWGMTERVVTSLLRQVE
jgi:8-oxo-dGTP pyrophosphatase MutT (NUDIX family)